MRFRFIGLYTGGRTSICMNGVRFDGHESREVPAEAVARLSGSIEFEAVAPPDEAPRRRGRPKKDFTT